MIELRDYQKKCEDGVREAFSEGHRAVLLQLATGGGKTYIFSDIGQKAARKGNSVLILVHRKNLIYQASMAASSLGEKHWIIANKKVVERIKIDQARKFGRIFIEYGSRITIGSVQTVVSRLNQVRPTLIIMDEAHHSITGQFRMVADSFPKARILGVSATPIRTDGVGLGIDCGGLYGSLINGPTPEELIKEGHLVPPYVIWPDQKKIDLSGVKRGKGGDYDSRELNREMLRQKPTIIGDAVKHYQEFANGKKAIVFCASVQSAQDAAKRFCDAGFVFKSLDGTLEDFEQAKIIEELANGEIHGITSCEIVSEGFDCPDLEVAILLRPTKSLILFMQQCGRILRPSPGKKVGMIIDAVGNCFEHGLPHWEREWTLEGKKHSKKQLNDERAVNLRSCPECFCIHETAPICPNCGKVYEVVGRHIQQKEGTMSVMTKEQEDALRAQKKMNRMAQGQAKGLLELQLHAKKMGYAYGWAEQVFRARGRKVK